MDGVPTTPVTHDEFIARAEALVPVFERNSRACLERRHLTEDAVEEIRRAELHKIMQPARFGGYQLGWDTSCAVAMTLGGACTSQAWVAAIYADHANHVGRFPIKAQDEVWQDTPDIFISSSLIPKGQKTTNVEGGYVLDGQYGFSSGVHHAAWGIIGCLRDVPEGPPEYFYCLVPSSDWTIIDDWNVTGMIGTGSCSVQLDDVFVPAHRTMAVMDAVEGTGEGSDTHDAPTYRTPHRLMGPFVFAAIAVAAGEAALAEYIKRTQAAPVGVGPDPSFAHLRIGECAAELTSARRAILAGADDAMTAAAAGPIPAEVRRGLRLDAPFAMKLTRQAVDRIAQASGARGLYAGDLIAALVQDVNAIASHIGLRWDLAAPLYARHRMGLEVPPTSI